MVQANPQLTSGDQQATESEHAKLNRMMPELTAE